MKKLLLLALPLALLLTAPAETIPLDGGKSVQVTLPASWRADDPTPVPAGMPELGTTVRYVTKNGSNDAILITLLPTPDDSLADPAALKALLEQAAERLIPGSVEGKANIEELRWAGARGFAATFTDAKLVGKPTRKEDYKTITTCFVHLGPRLLTSVTLFTDDLQSPAYAEARRILRSLTLATPATKI